MKKRYHMCQSIAGLEQAIEEGVDVRDWLTNDDGGHPSWLEIRCAIEEAKAKGYVVLPPCDHVKSTGHCAGHDVPYDGKILKEPGTKGKISSGR